MVLVCELIAAVYSAPRTTVGVLLPSLLAALAKALVAILPYVHGVVLERYRRPRDCRERPRRLWILITARILDRRLV